MSILLWLLAGWGWLGCIAWCARAVSVPFLLRYVPFIEEIEVEEPACWPSLSVIVPACDEATTLQDAMATLLALAVSQGIAPDYANELLAAFPDEVRQAVDFEAEMTAITQPLIAPLSERELEVLRLMEAGLRHKEVADTLVISLNTVRHHTRNIYGKLDVTRRAQAIARAQDMGLL